MGCHFHFLHLRGALRALLCNRIVIKPLSNDHIARQRSMALFSSSAVEGAGDIDESVDGLISQAQSMQLASSHGTNVASEVCIAIPSPSYDSYDFQGFSSSNQVEPCEDQCTCTHPYLNKWDGIYNCMDCECKLNDTPEAIEKNADRIALEAELERKTPVDVIGEGQSVGSMSAARDM